MLKLIELVTKDLKYMACSLQTVLMNIYSVSK